MRYEDNYIAILNELSEWGDTEYMYCMAMFIEAVRRQVRREEQGKGKGAVTKTLAMTSSDATRLMSLFPKKEGSSTVDTLTNVMDGLIFPPARARR